jgi:lipopolysaccharide/colanic/teichoic acid biosynthesis glycosyltransferase
VDRSLYPGHRFEVKKIGDPEADDKLLRICRQAMIDELPQVIDIIRGDMTLIGPRADKPEHIEELFASIEDEELRERWRTAREAQKPGIISAYAVHSHSKNLAGDPEYTRFSQSSEIASNALTRAQLDIYDAENASLRHDLRLLGRAARMAASNYLAYYRRMRSSVN